MPSLVELRPVTREDVQRLANWLDDPEVSNAWFGRYTYGDAAHLGYEPKDELDLACCWRDVPNGSVSGQEVRFQRVAPVTKTQMRMIM